MTFLLGFIVGYVIAAVTFWWAVMRDSDGENRVIVDAWWLESDNRWLGLAPILRRERAVTPSSLGRCSRCGANLNATERDVCAGCEMGS